jgi:hypothetical protein
MQEHLAIDALFVCLVYEGDSERGRGRTVFKFPSSRAYSSRTSCSSGLSVSSPCESREVCDAERCWSCGSDAMACASASQVPSSSRLAARLLSGWAWYGSSVSGRGGGSTMVVKWLHRSCTGYERVELEGSRVTKKVLEAVCRYEKEM